MIGGFNHTSTSISHASSQTINLISIFIYPSTFDPFPSTISAHNPMTASDVIFDNKYYFPWPDSWIYDWFHTKKIGLAYFFIPLRFT